MQAKKTLLAIAMGVAAQGAYADFISEGDLYADTKVRFESVDADDAADAKTANALTVDAAIGYETKEFYGFKVLAEYEVIKAPINNYAPETAGYDTVADPEESEWNRAQISYAKDGVTAVVGRQRIILDNARFVGNVGWRDNEQTFDAVTLGYTLGDVAVQYSYVDQVNGILRKFDADVSDHLLNVSYNTSLGKVTGYAYLLEDNDSDKTDDTYGVRFAGKKAINDTVTALYSLEYATQSVDTGAAEFDADYFALEAGALVKGVTLALGNETLGSDDGAYGFQTALATKHAFNGWADMFLATPADGLSDTYVKAAGAVKGVNLAAFYHTFDAVEGSDTYGSEVDVVASMVVAKTYTIGAKYASYSADDFGVDTDKFWLWAQTKF
ncbi:alginate export family protein [Thalassolituus sp. LLYu03]|uniref:alginate export family protein n=1 Tax=Thalassolituus sp. LLYu03 TaxID=3421656 RepID=UPI003D2B90DB